jgi:hypothetical protein
MHDSSLDRELASGARRVGEVRFGWKWPFANGWQNGKHALIPAVRVTTIGRHKSTLSGR